MNEDFTTSLSRDKTLGVRLRNTFGIEARAAQWVEYHSEDELKDIICGGLLRRRPYFCIGGGSNVLFTRTYYDQTFLHSAIRGLEIVYEDADEVEVRVGSGEVWDEFVQVCVDHGWYGAENLSLIPGEVGASAVQNIGAYGVEVKDLIVSVETLDAQGQKRVYEVSECGYGYRTSLFKRAVMKDVFVLYVNFRLSKHPCFKLDYGNVCQELGGGEVTLERVRKTIIDIRRRKLPDPLVQGNAGSFFINPVISRALYEGLQVAYPQMPHYDVDAENVKVPAGWLIEQAGWKGRRMGKVAVHDKQALVLVNLGGASGADVVRLAEAVQEAVFSQFGIEIQPEVIFL